MMIPRAMLAMREPWEKKRGGEKKTKQVSRTKFLGLGHLPQRNTMSN